MLIDDLLRDDTLLSAWHRVAENGGMAGTDGVNLKTFGADIVARIGRLRAEVRGKRYKPSALLQVHLPRPGKDPRLLAVPTVRDRLLQTAAALLLTPLLDPHFEKESFAYRPGRSVAQAIARVIEGRQAGYHAVVDADIHAYFDHIPHTELIRQLRPYLPDDSLLPLLHLWLEAPIQTQHGLERHQCGIPQGSPLSPLLSNLYLDPFDEAIARQDRWLVRYADDFVVLCHDNDSAERTLEEAAAWLAGAKLELNFDKTRVTSFALGFSFLGVRFEGDAQWAELPEAAPWLLPAAVVRQANRLEKAHSCRSEPSPAQPAATVATVANSPDVDSALPPLPASEGLTPLATRSSAAPLLRTLYLTEAGAYLHREGERIIVARGDEELASLPVEKIDQVLVDCEGAISFGALRYLLRRRVAVVVLDAPGEPLGAFSNLAGGSVELHRAQFRRADDPDFCLGLGRAIVAGKIANSRLLLRRYLRFRPEIPDTWNAALKSRQIAALAAPNLDSVRGHEGAAARAWFEALSVILGKDWRFNGRNRQPPRDPVNALLSYGYAVLFHSVWTLVLRRGLNPGVGALHACRNGHPALVSDLMEEFRALIVDATVIRFLLHSDLRPADLHAQDEGNDAGGYRLSQDLRRRFVRALEDKLAASVAHPLTGQTIDWRRAIQGQVDHWADVVQARTPVYRPWMPR
jgi:CRISPR-associated protein Cas1